MPTIYPSVNPVLFFYVGGASTPANASAVATIYYAAGGTGTGIGITWGTNSTALPTARWMLGGALSDSSEYINGYIVPSPPIAVAGGILTTGTLATTVTTLVVPLQTAPFILTAQEGTPAALATSFMGTGGSVVANSDGSQTITANFLGPGGPAPARFPAGLLAGDHETWSRPI